VSWTDSADDKSLLYRFKVVRGVFNTEARTHSTLDVWIRSLSCQCGSTPCISVGNTTLNVEVELLKHADDKSAVAMDSALAGGRISINKRLDYEKDYYINFRVGSGSKEPVPWEKLCPQLGEVPKVHVKMIVEIDWMEKIEAGLVVLMVFTLGIPVCGCLILAVAAVVSCVSLGGFATLMSLIGLKKKGGISGVKAKLYGPGKKTYGLMSDYDEGASGFRAEDDNF